MQSSTPPAAVSLLFGEQSMQSDAGFSPCGKYRYWLTRTWDNSRAPVAFCMLNPSTADASKDDPTIRRCISFARLWGHGGIIVVNLFALRATDPKELYSHPSPAYPAGEDGYTPIWGDANTYNIINHTDGIPLVAAWGCHGTFRARDREVMGLMGSRRWLCLGTTKDGHPRHPLYVAANAPLVPFVMKGGAA